MGKKPKLGGKTPASPEPRIGASPDHYKTMHPVWRFRSFDWDGPWGVAACLTKNWRAHIQEHLASFETMTRQAIEIAAGGKNRGTNSHPLIRDKFSKAARDRLTAIGIHGDSFFLLRLENTVRIYGIREMNSLRIIWFDPYHFESDDRACYAWR